MTAKDQAHSLRTYYETLYSKELFEVIVDILIPSFLRYNTPQKEKN